MKNIRYIRDCILVLFFVSLAACGSPVRQGAVEVEDGKIETRQARAKTPDKKQTSRPQRQASKSVKKKLYSQYAQWKGVRYKLGGLSKKGVDCSGFVYMTFRSQLGIDLPRTTGAQVKLGKSVKRDQLKTGDLVFFNTKVATKHVGIYLEQGKFLHASTSKGVMISKLDNVYWKSKYWKARRVEI